MKIIKGPIALERIGHWGRVVEYADSPMDLVFRILRLRKINEDKFEVQCQPFPPAGEAVLLGLDKDWGSFGGTVGYGSASFVRREDAIEFLEDIPKLDDAEMKKKWEKTTGALPLWDEVD